MSAHISRILRTVCASALTLACVPASARAQSAAEPLVTDRPDFTESAAVIPLGRYQLETGYTATRERGATEHAIGELLVRAGLAQRLELRVGFASVVVLEDSTGRSATEREDGSLGIKLRLLDGGPTGSLRPEAALLAGSTLPTGSNALRAPRLQPEAKLALAWSPRDRVAVSTNVGYLRVAEDARSYDELNASLSLGFGVSERIGAYAEVYGFSPELDSRSAFANGGITWLLSPDAQLDLRAGAGISGSSAVFIGLGFARRF